MVSSNDAGLSVDIPSTSASGVDEPAPATPSRPRIPGITVEGEPIPIFEPTEASSPLPSVHSPPSAPGTPPEATLSTDNSQLTMSAIPVLFKEAMLDTPTFRAHCEHMHKQFVEIEDWVQGIISRNSEINAALKPLRHSVNNVLEMFMPSFIYNNALDQSNLSVVFERYAEGVSLHWTSVMFEARKHISHVSTSYKAFRQGHLSEYAAARTKLIQQQKLFDKATTEYAALGRNTKAESLRDAAQQVYKFRLRYLKQSLVFCEVLIHHEKKLNEFIVDTLARPFHPDVPTLIPKEKRTEISTLMARASAYTRSQYSETAAGSAFLQQIRSDMLTDGRKRVPSKLCTDYDQAPAIWFDQPEIFTETETIKEKYGWLMLKLPPASRHSKPQWVRIWLFVKDGLMGWLSLSESKAYVQESPMLAVPLCDAKNSNEERNFCFTITTARVSFTLQAGNSLELKNWLAVIQSARKEFLDLSMSKYITAPLWANDVSCRYANKVLEGNGVTPRNGADDELAQRVSKRVDACIESISSDFTLVDRSGLFGSELYARLTPTILQQKPMATTRTLEAFIASSYVPPRAVPNAIIGNYGGSVNWSLYSDGVPKVQGSNDFDPVNIGGATRSTYPTHYPEYLQFHDIDMRSYFGPQIPNSLDEDLVVMVVRASMRLKETYYIPVTLYITGRNIFIISTGSGFTGFLEISVQNMLAIQGDTSTECDTVKLTYNGDNTYHEMDFKLYMDSGLLLQRRLQFLSANIKSKEPLELDKIINKLENIGRKHHDQLKSAITSADSQNPSTSSTLSFQEADNNSRDIARAVAPSHTTAETYIPEQHNANLKLFEDIHLNITPKQLFLLIFGDKSPIFGDVTTNKDELKWFYSENSVNRLFAINLAKLMLFGADSAVDEGIDVLQRLERREENSFYSVDELSGECKLYSASFRLRTKYVIALSRNGTRLMIYVGIEWLAESRKCAQVVLDKVFEETCEKRPVGLVKRIQNCMETLQKLPNNPRLYDLSQYGKVRITSSRTRDQTSRAHKKHHVSSNKLFVFVMQNFLTVLWWKLIKSIKSFVIAFVRVASIYRVLLLGILASLLMNVYFISLNGVDIWHNYFMVRSTEHYIDALHLSPKTIVNQKAIYSKDVEKVVQHARDFSEIAEENNTCWQSFKRIALTNPKNHPDQFGQLGIDHESQRLVDNMLGKRYDIGMKRNELLSELYKLEHAELELVRLEWKRWVLNEVKNCAEARKQVALSGKTGIELSLIEYCIPCIDAANLLL